VAESSHAGWEELTRKLSTRVAALAPNWTEDTDNDPGVTLVELFAFFAESLLARADLSPHARTRLRDILARLERANDSRCEDSTLNRIHFYNGKLLTADDLELEQSYHRTKHRRHNRLLHGIGIVRGLGVSLEPSSAGGDPIVVVSPGVAISPDGEELVLCEPATRDVCQGVSACYVTLSLVGRPADATLDGEHSRIEESAEVAVSEDVLPGHLAIARLLNESGVWRSDPGFRAGRATFGNAG
jgi:hypothetical protein